MSDEFEETPAVKKPSKEGSDSARQRRWAAAGIGFGIGSAALVGALLYANKRKNGAAKPKRPVRDEDADDS